MAHPSKIDLDPKIPHKAYKLCLLGATDAQLADFFEVDKRQITRWKEIYPAFREALRRGKDEADTKVAQALYHRATGYKHIAFKMFQHEGRVVTKRYVEHFPPDTTACIFWLKNRRSDAWRDRTEHTGPNGIPLPAAEMSTIEAARLVAFALETGRQAVMDAQRTGNAAAKIKEKS